MEQLSACVVDSFEDPSFDEGTWAAVLRSGETDGIALTLQSQRSWWLERGKKSRLMLTFVRRDGRVLAIAPLFCAGGLIMNLCPVGILDLLGDLEDPAVVDLLLQTALSGAPEADGFCFYFLRGTSPNVKRLLDAGNRLGLVSVLQDEQPSPYIDLRGGSEVLQHTRKQNMLRRERALDRRGELLVHHFGDAAMVLPQLDAFFDQHVERWERTPTPSRFKDPDARRAFARATNELADAGWLRFSRLDWNGRAIAYHRGTCYRGVYKYGKTSFAQDLASSSPGTVLLRHLILQAIDEKAQSFDFGFGDEAHKYRYATDALRLQTWGLYPPESSILAKWRSQAP